MSLLFFRPPEVHAESLILIGYRLYPSVRIDLHPRLTLLAGSNGVGKTTLLDVFQTILIPDQRYLHLNVASGQNDRDLGGQLQNRVAWAVLHLNGHPEIRGIGVHLSRRAASEYVDLKPFALTGISPDQDLFLNRETSKVVPDLKMLNQIVVSRSRRAAVKEFNTINDYHRFLYDKGLLPLDLSRGGKRQFSLLWRQATQPHLGELNHFLQQTLCHEPEKRLTFQDVEKLMQERLHAEAQLRRLGELKELNAELQEKARELEYQRRRFLGIDLGLAKQREEALHKEIEEGETRFRQLDEEIRTLKDELEGVRTKLESLGKERDKYVREQGDWSRKYKHYQEYVKNRKIVEELQDELTRNELYIPPLESQLEDIRIRIEAFRREMQIVSNELAVLKGKKNELERQARKWREFQKDLERVSTLLGKELRSLSDLESAWSEVNEERQKIQEIKPLRYLHNEWKSRAKAYRTAADLARKMIALWPDFFEEKKVERTLLDDAQAELRAREKEITLRREELSKEKTSLKTLREELSRGRAPLSPTAADLVERGLAAPFTKYFDNLELESARERQEVLGPLAHAVEPAPDTPLCELARGRESFFLVLSSEAWKEIRVLERTEHGTIAGLGGIGWYTPDGPVWIGAEAIREQIQRAQAGLLDIETELKDLNIQEHLIAKRRQAIQDFLPKMDSLADSQAPVKAEELGKMVQELEQTAPQIEKLYTMIQKLFQRSELFNFDHAPDQMEELEDEIWAVQERYSEMEDSLKSLRGEESECAEELTALESRFQSLERELDKAQTLCARIEEEEPEEILQGKVDFGQTEELTRRIQELDEERSQIQNALFSGERRTGELRNQYKTQGETLARLKQDLIRAQKELERASDLWKTFYPNEEPQPLFGFRTDQREHHKAVWENLAQVLKTRIDEVSRKYDFRLPDEDRPDHLVFHLLQLLLPPGIVLDQLEEQYTRLQHELQQIEQKIKSHVEEVRSGVETEIRRLRVHLVRVNRILSALNFGQIKKIYLELEELPPYQALKKLESLLRIITRGEAVTLRDFVDRLRAFIQRESNTTLTEEQIADYRSYIRIRRIIVDSNGNVREGGLSSGETLGVNLALCLAILFFIGREQGVNRERGMLLLALDEAERLDAKALETIRTLLDDVRCQLTVAMPRPVDIPDSICHLLTPLAQGVTHVHLYHKEGLKAGRLEGGHSGSLAGSQAPAWEPGL